MIDRPSTRPGITIGSEAMLSSIQRPGIFVRSTIQAMTAESSVTPVAQLSASTTLFHTASPKPG